MSEKRTRNIGIIALVLSLLSLSLYGVNTYYLWYVPKRAELSIILTKFSYSIASNPLTLNTTGLITNEGSRTTIIKGVEVKFTFLNNKSDLITFSIGFPYSTVHIGKEILTEKEATNFNYTGLLWSGMVSPYGVAISDFTKFEIVINHDDGIGLLSNSGSKPIEGE